MLPQRAAFVIHSGIGPSYTYVFNRVSLQSKQLVFRSDNAFPPGTQVLKLHSTCTPSISQPLHWICSFLCLSALAGFSSTARSMVRFLWR